MLKFYNSAEKKEKRIARAKTGAKARWEGKEAATEPLTYAIETVDPLYTLTFTDHLINKTWVFTLHKGNRIDSFRIDVNGQPFRDGGWSIVLAEIRKKRVKIQSMRSL